jgi:UDP-GlcNAc:undecaprenyl-phosphate GlcNAc-1-phosphate transferase
MVQNILIIFIISFVLSAVFTPLLRLIALKREFLSYPGVRRIHTKPVPYLGGIAMYFAFFMALLYIFSVPSGKISGTGLTHCHFEGLAIAAAFIVIVGFIDDVREIKPLAKLAAQIISAVILFIYGFRIPVLTNVFSGVETKLPFFFSFFLTIFWIVGFMNAMNLIDGLDGLAAGITSIACFSLFFVALYLNNYLTAFLLAALAGSSLGFLIYNFHPA